MFDDPINANNNPVIPTPPTRLGDQAPPGIAAQSGTGNVDNSANSIKPSAAIEDIFNETEAGEKPAVFYPKEPGTPDQGVQDVENVVPTRLPKKVLIGLVITTGVLLLGYAAYWGYNWWKSKSTVEIIPPTVNTSENNQNGIVDTQNKVQPATSPENNNQTAVPSADTIKSAPVNAVDSDQDGLSDIEEIESGTDPNNIDSDADGLSDREEVKVYKTNPLNADTDGDSFQDGSEVKGGYNPNGAGKLYEI